MGTNNDRFLKLQSRIDHIDFESTLCYIVSSVTRRRNQRMALRQGLNRSKRFHHTFSWNHRTCHDNGKHEACTVLILYKAKR